MPKVGSYVQRENEIRERQQMFISEDVDGGLILAFMQETRYDRVCSKMLFKEALHNEFVQPQRWQTNDICETVNQLIKNGKLKGWRYFSNPKRFPGTDYGTQRGWEKIPEVEQQTDNKEDANRQLTLTDAFMELPSDEPTPFDAG